MVEALVDELELNDGRFKGGRDLLEHRGIAAEAVAAPEQALARMRIALSETVVEGILTNIPLHRELMVDAKFVEGGTSIHYLEGWMSQHNR